MSDPVDGILDVTTFDQLDEAGIERLATYNAEVDRGIVHTAKYSERMAKLQARFDRHQAFLSLPDPSHVETRGALPRLWPFRRRA